MCSLSFTDFHLVILSLSSFLILNFNHYILIPTLTLTLTLIPTLTPTPIPTLITPILNYFNIDCDLPTKQSIYHGNYWSRIISSRLQYQGDYLNYHWSTSYFNYWQSWYGITYYLSSWIQIIEIYQISTLLYKS